MLINVVDFYKKTLYYLDATYMVETGQGRKTAALISSMCVHLFFWRFK